MAGARTPPRGVGAHLRLQALLGVGRMAFWQVDLDHGAAILEEAQTLARDQDDEISAALAGTWLGAVRRRQARYVEAQALLEESLRQHEAHGQAAPAAWAVFNLGQIANRETGTAESVRLNNDGLRRYRALGNVRLVAMLSVLLAADLASLGDLDRVPRLLEDGLDVLEETRDRVFMATGLLTMATIASDLGQADRAARLLGSVVAFNASQGLTLPPNAREYYLRIQSSAADEAIQAGRRMTLEEAFADVREMVQLVRLRLDQGFPTPAAAGDFAAGLCCARVALALAIAVPPGFA